MAKYGRYSPVKFKNFAYFSFLLIPLSRRGINFSRQKQKQTKSADFTGLYFWYFAIFCDETLEFYKIQNSLSTSGCADHFLSSNFVAHAREPLQLEKFTVWENVSDRTTSVSLLRK